MTDLLFIELGAVVTEILGPSQCTIVPFCDPAGAPTYGSEQRFEVDFAQSLDELLLGHGVDEAAQQAQYDVIVAPSAGRRVQIGRRWPGGGYEGILCVRESVVQGNALLAAAAKTLAGARCRYQVVASIAQDKSIRRYHGHHAQVLRYEGAKIVFKRVNRNEEITYDPEAADCTVKFYAGDLVDGNILRGGLPLDSTGAVFMNPAELTLTGPDDDYPKLPPSAGL